MKKVYKNEKGITLIILVITVIVLVIVTYTLAINSYSSLELSKLTKLENDIQSLNDRVSAYFVENEKLPIYQEAGVQTKDDLRTVLNDMSVNDGEIYYVIDTDLLDNITLNYGSKYRTSTQDRFIINEESHVIYYIKGIVYDGEEYHTTGANPAVI